MTLYLKEEGFTPPPSLYGFFYLSPSKWFREKLTNVVGIHVHEISNDVKEKDLKRRRRREEGGGGGCKIYAFILLRGVFERGVYSHEAT